MDTLKARSEHAISLPAGLVEKLHGRAMESLPALRGEIALEDFSVALRRSADSRFYSEPSPGPAELRAYLESLNVAELALACACAAGNKAAWEHFMAAYRPDLYSAARAIAGAANYRELADSLYGDLYGLEERDGRRRSLFEYFHGRSKLSTWLRAVLAQRFVDAVRAARRTVPLDTDEGAAPGTSQGVFSTDVLRAPTHAPDVERIPYLAALQTELTAALRSLDPKDRLRLSYYYVHDLTLAQIGRLTSEHEATVSRKLERTRRDLRKRVTAALRDRRRLTDQQIELCYQYARQEWPFDLTAVLTSGAEK